MSFIIYGSHTKCYLYKQIENEMGRPCLTHGKLENTCRTILKTCRATNRSEYLGLYGQIVFEDDVILKPTAEFCLVQIFNPCVCWKNPQTCSIPL